MLKRVNKQLKDFKERPSSNIHILTQKNEANKVQLLVRVIGPAGSLYQFVNYNLQVKFPTDYPFKPPKIAFLTKIYHPNVYYGNGNVCCCTIPMLNETWSPAFTVQKILEQVVRMLQRPFDMLSDCGDSETILMFKNNYEEFKKRAMETALIHNEKDNLD